MSNASTVGALRVVLGLDSAAFEGGISKAQKHLRTAGKQMQDTGVKIATAGAAATATITTAFAALGFHLLQGSQDAAAAAAQVNASLASMGDGAGKTFEELSKTAEALRNLTGIDDDEILSKVTANLLTFGNIIGPTFDRAQEAILDISAKLKTDLQSATLMVGKALNNPTKGLTALTKAGLSFTDQQIAQIKAMQAVGDIAGAQAIMLAALETQVKGSAKAAGDADIWKPLKTALMDLEGAFEPLVRDVMAPLIKQVADLTRSFAGLSPETQKFVVVGAAIAAALGPALVAIGSVVTAVGAITTALGSGGAIAGIVAALAPLAPIILPIAAAVGVAVAAFLLFREQVTPVLVELWRTAQQVLGPAFGQLFDASKEAVASFAALMKQALDSDAGQALVQFGLTVSKIMGSTLIQVLGAAVKLVATAITAISDGFKVLGALLRGDFSGAWDAYRAGTARAVEGIRNALGGLATFAVDQIRRMVSGVTEWLQGKLFSVLRGVIERVKGVSDAFFRLYDAVVGHSYIPDMVTEVGQWMARLDKEMVEPAKKAANATAEAFEQVRDRANAAMENVLTEQERAWREHQRQVRALEGGIAQGGPDADIWRNGLARENAGWDAYGLTMPDTLPDLTPIEDSAGYKSLQQTWDRIKQQIHDSREQFADSFSWGMQSALRGDWSSLLQSILSATFDSAFKNLGRSLFDSMGGGSPGGFSFGNIGAAFSKALSWLPGFQHGGSIKEGGAGGIDSQLVAFWKSPSERVDIYTPGSDRGPVGGMVFDLRGAVTTSDLISQMNRIGQVHGDRAYGRSVQDVPKVSASKAEKSRIHTAGRRRT